MKFGGANSVRLARGIDLQIVSLWRRGHWLLLDTDAIVTFGISFAVFKMCLVLHPSLVFTFGYHYYWLVAFGVRATIIKSHT